MGCSPSGASFPGSGDSTSASSGPVCELCGNASRTPSASGSSRNTGRGSLVIPTCAPLWPAHVGQRCPCRCYTSTSSAAASPARTSPSPEGRPGSTGGARVFGASTFDSLTFFDPATSSWRTFATSLLATAADGSEEFSGTWPRAGMTRSGIASRLAPSAPLTGATGSGLLPTPNSRDWKDTGPSQGNRKSPNLGTVAHWATPTKSDGTGGPGNSGRQGGENLRTQVGGSLNPTWVEWLMGFPLGWTDLEPSETASSPRSRSGSAAASSPTSKKPGKPKRPKGSSDAMCVCGHPRSAHHGTGPCLVAVSGITGRDLDVKAKGSPSAPTNSICACSAYAEKP
jgi:hypothetical protein